MVKDPNLVSYGLEKTGNKVVAVGAARAGERRVSVATRGGVSLFLVTTLRVG